MPRVIVMRRAVAVAAGVLVAGSFFAADPAQAVNDRGDRWTPKPGEHFKNGWRTFDWGATFRPCSVVRWHFDSTGAPSDRLTMAGDVAAAFTRIESVTGLAFIEVRNPDRADIRLEWTFDIPDDLPENTRGYTQTSGPGSPSTVRFSALAQSNTDEAAGWGPKEITYVFQDGQRAPWRVVGRESHAVHEILHALGFDHSTAWDSMMNPQAGPLGSGQFGESDLQGLKTVYPQNACSASSANNVKFDSCVDMERIYPNGIARSKKAARVIVRQGAEKPVVSKKVYRKSDPTLDANGDGVMCSTGDRV